MKTINGFDKLQLIDRFSQWYYISFIEPCKIFDSFPYEPGLINSSAVRKILCAVIDTSNEVKCPLLQEFWIYNFSWRILERDFAGSIINIRNEFLFSEPGQMSGGANVIALPLASALAE